MIQKTFPEGGDSRKQISLIFIVTFIGCWIFVIYALMLFLRYKSKEIGVQLALGATKSKVTKYLSKEIRKIMASYTMVGAMLGVVLSFLFWEMFRNVFIEGSCYHYMVSVNSVVILLLFVILNVGTTSFICKRYMKKSSILNFIYEQHTSETMKIIGIRYGILGVFFIVLGIILGYAVPVLVAHTLGKKFSGWWGTTYIFTVIGIYMSMVYAVMGFNKGKNKQKYYQTILSSGMMKFQGKQTVKNMCVITLMFIASLFAFFYIPQLRSSVDVYMQSQYDVSIPTRAEAAIMNESEIFNLAKEYSVKVKDYKEVNFSELLGSGVNRDWDDEGNLIESYEEYYEYSEFMSEDMFTIVTGKKVTVEKGRYLLITSSERSESFWEKNDDLDIATNPINQNQISIKYQDTVPCICLLRNGVKRYILNNDDYLEVSAGLKKSNRIKQTLFSLKGNTTDKYLFSTELYSQLLKATPESSAVVSSYDAYQEKKVELHGQEYQFSDKLNMSTDNTDLMAYWKYYPIIKPFVKTQYMQSTMAFFMVFIYAGLICMVAFVIIESTRTKILAINNKKYFTDLNKLGAKKTYLEKCLKNQVKKIYVLPSVMGSLLMILFNIIMLKGNDNKFSMSDFRILLVDFCIVILIGIIQYIVFKVSMLQAREILFTQANS